MRKPKTKPEGISLESLKAKFKVEAQESEIVKDNKKKEVKENG